jgi:chemotaxis protein methyltransferase CheR
MAISRSQFEYVQWLIHQRAGLVVETGKEYLVESRLEPLARREGFASLQAFLVTLSARPFDGLHQKLVQAMTTNETLFFRDVTPFELLRAQVLPDLILHHASDRRLSFWCAACSTGQEPYSVAMLLREHFPEFESWNVRFIASDLSTEALARAIRGRYSQLEINRGLPAQYLVKYFTKRDNEWQIRDDIRRMIEFRELNLAERWSFLPQVDVIFIRNVLIYFNLSTKREVLVKAAQHLQPWGYLFLGSSETTLSIVDEFEPLSDGRGACYRYKNRKVP